MYLSAFILTTMIYVVIKHLKFRNHINKEKISTILIFGVMIFLISLRHPSMGHDLGYGIETGYLGSFVKIQELSFWQIIELEGFLNYEKGYIIFNKFCGMICEAPQFLLVACAFASLVPIAYMIYKKSNDIAFSAIIYLGLPTFVFLFSGLRQSIAIGISFIALKYIEERKVTKFVIAIIIAFTFHSSAIFAMIAYPVYYLQLGKKERIVTVLLLIIVFVFRTRIFLALGYSDIEHNGSVMLLIIFTFIYIFSFIYYEKEDIEVNGYLNLFYIACICQCFAEIHTLAMRVGYYFMIYLCLLLPRVINNIQENRIYIIIKTISYCAFFIFAAYLLVSTEWASAVPYVFFWN